MKRRRFAANIRLNSQNTSRKFEKGILKIGLAATVTAGLAIGSPEYAKAESYKDFKIAFQSDRDGNSEIYVMNADGSDKKRLTNNNGIDTYPSWSPDGTKIVFSSTRDGGNFEIYVMNADGSDQKNLTNNYVYDDFPSWSPDGKKIAFISYKGENPYSSYDYDVYVMNADGSEMKKLINNTANYGFPSWSPDSNKMAFECYVNWNSEIFIMNADGSEQKNLTNSFPDMDTSPSWSPDGSKIAFHSMRGGYWEIHVMNADGRRKKRLTDRDTIYDFPSWSPDGRMIAFESVRDGNAEIYVMNADGSELRRLTNNPARDCMPSWSLFLPHEVSVKELENIPDKFALSQNYPNSFNSNTTITYYLPVMTDISLDIYNLIGQKVKTLVNEKQARGTYSIQWDRKADNGIYVNWAIRLTPVPTICSIYGYGRLS